MKNLNILLIFLLFLFSCTKDYNTQINTGLIGEIRYGIGDCMPIIDETSRVYNLYSGLIYFIVKSDLDSLGNGSFSDLQAKSIKKYVVNGNIEIELPADTFLIMPSDVYSYSPSNTIIVKKGIVLSQCFKFWKCTSY